MILVRNTSFVSQTEETSQKLFLLSVALLLSDISIYSLMLSNVHWLDDDAQHFCLKHWCSFKVFQFRFCLMNYEQDSSLFTSLCSSLYYTELHCIYFPRGLSSFLGLALKIFFLHLHFIYRSWSWCSSHVVELSRFHGTHC